MISPLKFLIRFKNPFGVWLFRNGIFTKGIKKTITPRRGQAFFVARGGDFWLIDKILDGKTLLVESDMETEEKYIVENGIRLRGGTSDTFIFKEIFIDGVYKKFTGGLNKNSNVIDIGSHIGLFSLLTSPRCGKIFAYEAHPKNYKLAKQNVKENGFENIKLNNLAVWSSPNKNIEISDNRPDQTGCHHIVNPNDSENIVSYTVKTTTLERIFIENDLDSCDLLKIDAEGSEYEIIMNTPENILSKIKTICLEYHPDVERKRERGDLVKFLKEAGFKVELVLEEKTTGLIYATK